MKELAKCLYYCSHGCCLDPDVLVLREYPALFLCAGVRKMNEYYGQLGLVYHSVGLRVTRRVTLRRENSNVMQEKHTREIKSYHHVHVF